VKFLIDECLSAELANAARRAGHPEASHVAWIGKRGWKDRELKRIILDGDWVFVTRNSVDFRGSSKSPGSSGQYVGVPLHAGRLPQRTASHEPESPNGTLRRSPRRT
jgi:predicted nuclease of predicted toxin-antitoxin system